MLANDTDPDGDTLTVALATGADQRHRDRQRQRHLHLHAERQLQRHRQLHLHDHRRHGTTSTATVTITVTPVNDAPVAVNDTATTAEDTAFTGTAERAGQRHRPRRHHPDRRRSVAGPTNGTLTLNADGTFTYTPTANFNGTDTFTYRASDGTLNSANMATVTITVTPANDAPTVSAASHTTAEDTALNATLPTATDPEGSTLTYALATGPTSGSVTVNPNGTFTYTPAANFTGTDTFTYTATDGTLTSTAATVTITVTPVNDPPTAGAPDPIPTTAQDTPLNGTLPAATDPENNPLTYAVATQPTSGGTVTVNPDGSYTYTPSAGFTGLDSFTYTVSDGTDSSTAAFTIDVISAL